MRRSRSSTLFLALLFAAARSAQGQASEGAAFLLLPVGARAVALGQAGVADGGTTEALFWNPAGLADVRKTEIALHHFSFFLGRGDAIAVAIPGSGGVFSAAIYIIEYGETEFTNGGTGISRNIALEASYATGLFGGLSGGIAYKLIQFRVDCGGCVNQVVGTTHALDVGLRYVLPTAAPIVLGASLRNLGFKLQVNNREQADPLPMRLQVGAAWVVVQPAAETPGFDVRLLADVQGVVGQGGDMDPATLVGIESGVREAVRVRAGYAFIASQSRGPSLGLGVQVGRLGFDIAKTFYPADAIADQEPFHVSVRFGF